jgi:hypothetical protein
VLEEIPSEDNAASGERFGPRLVKDHGKKFSLEKPCADMSQIYPEEESSLSETRSPSSGSWTSPSTSTSEHFSEADGPSMPLPTASPSGLPLTRRGSPHIASPQSQPCDAVIAGQLFEKFGVPVDRPTTPLHLSVAPYLKDKDEDLPREHIVSPCNVLDLNESSPSSDHKRSPTSSIGCGGLTPGAMGRLSGTRNAKQLQARVATGVSKRPVPTPCKIRQVPTPCRAQYSPVRHDSSAHARQSLQNLIYAEATALASCEAVQEGESQHISSAAIRKQLQADSCRGRYFIDGKEFWYAKECSIVGEFEQEDAAIAFPHRLLAAISSCVEEPCGIRRMLQPPEALLTLVMLLLTQIGLALASIACEGPRLALCGGTREITYELQRVGLDGWEIQSRFRASGFKMFQDAGSLETACPCNPSSSITRAFTVRLTLNVDEPVGFRIDVQDVFEDIHIVDMASIPIPLTTSSGEMMGKSMHQISESPTTHVDGIQGCQQGLLMQCSAGRCSAPSRSDAPCFGGVKRTSFWAKISGACVPGPDVLFEEPTAGEVLIY